MDRSHQIVFVVAALVVPLAAVALIWIVWKRRGRWNVERTRAVLQRFQGVPGIAAAVGFAVFVGWVNLPGSFLLGVCGSIPMACVFASTAFAPRVVKRIGTERRCAKCAYDLSGVWNESAPASENVGACPECGASLTRYGGTVVGHWVFSKKLAVVMALFMVPFCIHLGAVIVGQGLALQRALLRFAPTGSLIAHVGNSRSFTMFEWDELNTRQLSQAQIDKLASNLLTRRALSLHSGSTETKWLVKMFGSGALSRVHRREALQRFVSLEAVPAADGVSREFHLSADQSWGLDGVFTGWSLFAVRGEVLDGAGKVVVAASREESPLGISELAASPSMNALNARGPVAGLIQLGLLPPKGQVSVWIIAEPRDRSPAEVVWNAGAPVVATDAVVVRFDFE